jgi:outer membrane protein
MKKFIRALPKVAAMSMLAASSFPAFAQSAGSNVVNLGWFHLDTHDSSEPLNVTQGPPPLGRIPGSGAEVDSADTLGIAYTHFFTDNFALTLDAGVPPKFNLQGTGTLAPLGHLGSAKQWSPAVIAKWYFGNADDKFRPFVGIGATHVWYTSVNLSRSLQTRLAGPTGTASADLSSSWAPVANVGLTYNFDKNWSLGFSVSYIPLDTDAELTGRVGNTVVSRARTKLTLDPLVTFLSVGYKF